MRGRTTISTAGATFVLASVLATSTLSAANPFDRLKKGLQDAKNELQEGLQSNRLDEDKVTATEPITSDAKVIDITPCHWNIDPLEPSKDAAAIARLAKWRASTLNATPPTEEQLSGILARNIEDNANRPRNLEKALEWAVRMQPGTNAALLGTTYRKEIHSESNRAFNHHYILVFENGEFHIRLPNHRQRQPYSRYIDYAAIISLENAQTGGVTDWINGPRRSPRFQQCEQDWDSRFFKEACRPLAEHVPQLNIPSDVIADGATPTRVVTLADRDLAKLKAQLSQLPAKGFTEDMLDVITNARRTLLESQPNFKPIPAQETATLPPLSTFNWGAGQKEEVAIVIAPPQLSTTPLGFSVTEGTVSSHECFLVAVHYGLADVTFAVRQSWWTGRTEPLMSVDTAAILPSLPPILTGELVLQARRTVDPTTEPLRDALKAYTAEHPIAVSMTSELELILPSDSPSDEKSKAAAAFYKNTGLSPHVKFNSAEFGNWLVSMRLKENPNSLVTIEPTKDFSLRFNQSGWNFTFQIPNKPPLEIEEKMDRGHWITLSNDPIPAGKYSLESVADDQFILWGETCVLNCTIRNKNIRIVGGDYQLAWPSREYLQGKIGSYLKSYEKEVLEPRLENNQQQSIATFLKPFEPSARRLTPPPIELLRADIELAGFSFQQKPTDFESLQPVTNDPRVIHEEKIHNSDDARLLRAKMKLGAAADFGLEAARGIEVDPDFVPTDVLSGTIGLGNKLVAVPFLRAAATATGLPDNWFTPGANAKTVEAAKLTNYYLPEAHRATKLGDARLLFANGVLVAFEGFSGQRGFDKICEKYEVVQRFSITNDLSGTAYEFACIKFGDARLLISPERDGIAVNLAFLQYLGATAYYQVHAPDSNKNKEEAEKVKAKNEALDDI